MQPYIDKLRERYVDQQVKWATIGGLLLLIIGVFGPWAKISAFGLNVSTNGFDHKGGLCLFIALACLGGIAAYVFTNVNIQQLALLWGLVVGVVMIDLMLLLDFLDIQTTDLVTTGWGLWLAMIGAAAATVGAVLPMWSQIRTKASDMTQRGPSA
jgi:hypothetical protein